MRSNISALSLNYISEVSKVQNKLKPSGGPKKSQTNGYRMYPVGNDRNSILNHHGHLSGSSPGFGPGHRSNSFDLGPRAGGGSTSKHR